MLVATFGPSSAWEGRQIYWDDNRYVLYGHGPIPAAGVVDYDRQGHLLWASPELQTWAYSVAQWEAAGRPASPSGAAAGPSQVGAQPIGEAANKRGLPAWAIVLIIAGISVLVLGILLAVLVPAFVIRTGETVVNDVGVTAGVSSIQSAIESWAADHDGTYPDPESVNGSDLSRYVTEWPTNPYTDLPMAQGAGLGNFLYEVDAGRRAYRLVGYGRDGKIIVELRGGAGATY